MGIETQARDNRCCGPYAGEQLQGRIRAVADDHEAPLWLPAMDQAHEVARPHGNGLVATLTTLGIPL
jgi:hypothetical protein